MKMKTEKNAALKYHSDHPAGKLAISPTKKCLDDKDLSLAYSPGVAFPCLEISKSSQDSYKYTGRGNLVGVISNGTAVLGLGDIGPLASKPVMEGKAILFKKFADVNAFDIEINENDPQKVVDIVKSLEPTFGGINLEDIKAPDCFFIEEKLSESMNIPVFQDDQHGTAIITVAALLNSLDLVKKHISNVKIIISGAGAAGISIARTLVESEASKENIFLFDSKGLIHKERKDCNKYKLEFVQKDNTSLSEALHDADVFIGVSQGNLLTPEMIKSMSSRPIIFAMANPVPEILPELVKKVVPDAIIATGRSDYNNQVNNVLCFPFIFRGALDVHATSITKRMRLAAVKALSKLAYQEVPEEVTKIYGENITFGLDYIIPKPFDPRLLPTVAVAVAEAAIKDLVAQKKIDLKRYHERLVDLAKKLKSTA